MEKWRDIGFQALEEISQAWQIDVERITWHEHGFDWWPGHFRQSLRVSEGPLDWRGMPTWCITAVTDFLKDVDVGSLEARRVIDAFGQLAPSYSLRLPPPRSIPGIC
jgi:hypothetical protein